MGASSSTTAESDGLGYTLDKNYSLQIKHKIDVASIITLAEQAGLKIKEIYQTKEAENWDVELKSDSSPLTRADKESNQIICENLTQLTPHIPIVSEENKQIDFETRKNYQCCWCVDPLDGTKEFLKRNGQFTVNIALIQEDEPVLGVVHTPMAGTTHWAVKGQGAYVRFEGEDKRISCEVYDPEMEGLWIVASSSHMSPTTEDFIKQYKSPKFRQLGSSLKLLLVAEGLAHVYPRMAPTCEWDTAASHIIVTEAGGRVVQAGECDSKGNPLEDWKTALEKNLPLKYNKQFALNPFFVVYGKEKLDDENVDNENKNIAEQEGEKEVQNNPKE